MKLEPIGACPFWAGLFLCRQKLQKPLSRWRFLHFFGTKNRAGHKDHTTSPYAATSFVSPPFDRSQIFRPALQPRCSPDAAASTAFHPASVTIAIRPLWWGRIRRVLEVIWGCWKRKYFCKWDSTQVSTNRPTGKSLDASERLSRVPDAVQRPSRCSVEPGPTRGDTELYNGPRINSAPP